MLKRATTHSKRNYLLLLRYNKKLRDVCVWGFHLAILGFQLFFAAGLLLIHEFPDSLYLRSFTNSSSRMMNGRSVQ